MKDLITQSMPVISNAHVALEVLKVGASVAEGQKNRENGKLFMQGSLATLECTPPEERKGLSPLIITELSKIIRGVK